MLALVAIEVPAITLAIVAIALTVAKIALAITGDIVGLYVKVALAAIASIRVHVLSLLTSLNFPLG